jgi:hypothetical protein
MATQTRVAYSPGEFAELFGKSQTWGYRQIYAGKINAITEHGRILIPAKEVERVLETAGIYNGREKPKRAKERLERLTTEQKSIWQRFLDSRRHGVTESHSPKSGADRKSRGSKLPMHGERSRPTVLGKIAKSWSGKAKGD